ncbi:7,8-didemethyl-8-hydroxy-5-deazariboflavin synthase CofG [Microbacterium sp. CJ88]|uniref:7,8-didemethyl-8-hydroxy-5-deazariboflavin synthase CofG n=1 Tax=Microbacterium sp. CJ88 TaxID=3445672 RepID=UPI003F65648A
MTLIDRAAADATAERIATALSRVESGGRLDTDDAEALLSATGGDAARIRAAAASLRDAGLVASGRPGIITYSRKVFVPLTTLCRDRCHYCIFVDTPNQLLKMHKPVFMSPEQVLAVVRQGAALGCKEVLLTLGDRPEDRWPEARAWLDDHGFASTIEYVAHIARLVTAETGMLAHANPGVMSYDELRMLRPTAPSMGMMLETTSRRLFEEPGQVHYGSPDKDPDLRLRVIDDAGRAAVPFTTGILVGIGETLRDRAESLVAIRDAHERHGHVQEVIVQNFRAKPRTAMQSAPDASVLEYVAAVAVARLVMGPRMRIQVPPNLSDPAEFELLVQAGADDWGGVSPLTADHVNPERPWPHLSDLAERTAELGFELRERLTAQSEFVQDAETWIDPALRGAVADLADPETGLARADASPANGPDSAIFDSVEPHGPENTDRMPEAPADRLGPVRATGAPAGLARLAEAAAADPLALGDDDWTALLRSTGADLEALVQAADDVRRYTVGEAVSLVANRNLASSGLRTTATDEPGTYTLDDAAAIARDADDLGITEICVQGRMPAHDDPDNYLALIRTLRAAAPRMHLHAYRPQDIADLSSRTGLVLDDALSALRDAGVDTVPGTGVKVLTERVRALVAPEDLGIEEWIATITAAHRAGFSSTSVLFYGHVETAAERIAHLRRLRAIQDDTGGFTEFVPIPLPGPAGGAALADGRAPLDEHRAMVAVSRLLLNGSIRHIQIPWTRVGRATAAALLQAGGDDLGGTLLDGRVRPDAGAEQGLELPIQDAAQLVGRLFRPFRQRTTDYREPAADRRVAL